MTHVFGRSSAKLRRAVAGDGCYIIDADGTRFLDGCCGAAVSCLGHSDETVRAAMHAQIDAIAYAHTGYFTSGPAEDLADLLIDHAPDGIERVYFLSGGSEAMETALKLARQYMVETGQGSRHRIIARRQSYHGNTLGALAVGGNAMRREKYAPLLVETSHISPCFEYRHRAEGESARDYGLRAANELEAEILRLGPETVMAFVAEPVVGATAGAVPAVEGYFRRIREICDHYGVLLILDEVMCGMGRTGTLFASEQEGVSPDIVVIAKGLGAGYVPIGAMLCSGTIYDAITGGSGAFEHGHTYQAHPTSAAGALAVVRALLDRGLLDRVKEQGDKLQASLTAALGQHAHVGDIRGRGLFRAVELVADRATKEPFDPARKLGAALKAAAMDEGLMIYPGNGTADGWRGDHILIAPPFIISDDQIDELTTKLTRALTKVLAA
ncbi:aspartate aminotransferase family protein [Gymnodinialimonas sp.]